MKTLVTLAVVLWAVPVMALPICSSRGRAVACRLDDGTVAIRVGNGPWVKHKPLVRPEADPIQTPIDPDVAPLETAPDGPVVIDILVVGTTRSIAGQGGLDAFGAFAQLAIDTTNQTIAHTGIPDISVRLAGVAEWVYTEAGSLAQDLSILRATGAVKSMAIAVGADTVVGISESGDYCGVAQLTATSADNAYAMVNRGCAVGNLSFPHEWGHNVGMQHDRGSVGQWAFPVYPYSYGYIAPDCSFRDVMSYPICAPRLNHYSSPRITINGQPAGTATEDNDLTLRNRAATVAAFRASVSTSAPRPASNVRVQ